MIVIVRNLFKATVTGALITIPPTNDRLVPRRLDIGEILGSLGDDSPAVTSPGTLTAEAGQSFRHRVEARSKKGGLKYAVARGPDGMIVSPEGELRWDAPPESKGRNETVVLSVHDASGRERFHMIRIDLR